MSDVFSSRTPLAIIWPYTMNITYRAMANTNPSTCLRPAGPSSALRGSTETDVGRSTSSMVVAPTPTRSRRTEVTTSCRIVEMRRLRTGPVSRSSTRTAVPSSMRSAGR